MKDRSTWIALLGLASVAVVVGALLVLGHPWANVVAIAAAVAVGLYGAVRVGIEYEQRRSRQKPG